MCRFHQGGYIGRRSGRWALGIKLKLNDAVAFAGLGDDDVAGPGKGKAGNVW